MDALTRLRLMLRIDMPGFVLFHDLAIAPESICWAIRSHLDRPVTIARLRSDSISPEDADFLREALLNGSLLLLIAPEARTLPAELLRAWQSFRREPRHTSSGAGRFIRFNPDDADRDLGILGLILPRSYEISQREIEPGGVIWLHSANELGQLTAMVGEPRELGRPAVQISMKELCFLHHRDTDDAEHHASVHEIMNGERPLTWCDLQLLLRQQADTHMLDIIVGFEKDGRITTDKVDLAAAAIPYLRDERFETERIGSRGLAPTIYHLLWMYYWLAEQGYVFRGQRNNRWRQDATLLRPNDDGSPAELGQVLQRLSRTQAFLDELAKREQEIVGRALNEDERLAIAQHYGLPTPLLDYTHSLAIAAFFATGAGDLSAIRESDVGVIYFLRPSAPFIEDIPPELSAKSRFDFASAAGLRFGRLRTIEPALPDPENRIARQKGVFIDGFDSRDLQRLAVGVLYFRQQAGEAFEDVRLGITRERLLSPDAKLEKLAKEIAAEPPQLSRYLTTVRLPADDIFGALGIMLSSNLFKAQEFLNRLAVEAERIEAGLWPAIEEMLHRHFGEARIAARTADVSAPAQLALTSDPYGVKTVMDEVNATLEELATLVGLDNDLLRGMLRQHRPVLEPIFNPEPVNEPPELPNATPRQQVALAVGLFLVGLEYLRTVRGPMAEQYIQHAEFALIRAIAQ